MLLVRPLESAVESLARQIILPLFLFIDLYYRTEWFYLHTGWGHIALAALFGGE